ncbi:MULTISPECIES: hypothetical protein [unclassified Paenibacillus]|uniref:hypothetical protein n=1 Tax=unclassified Paenibacillus TaxID=185978 RepID=UPI002406FE3B|nr:MULTISPECIES: hypothetical protein [unclassified Paenibacillus]MDF9843760.1 hypothetical protein [Paenibacillus sp. PastF-2]MDF9850401.1 hypothetical protein [Paenibacillus sp. PastM-2]MDF9856896.1 hypothetical protein [Paenibacillus sp. PastF-1]MDH6482247.1 hypothetical protein [Paenibacillus sp. PastH-2]MDH6509589.1 hypothetical protein [Paenibacillus sp. PastM-3]
MIEVKFSYIILGAVICFILSACADNNIETRLSKGQANHSTKTDKAVVYSEVQLVHFNKEELINAADTIIKGTVLSQEVQKSFEGFPATDTIIQVQTVYKGEPGETVEIRTEGGETEDMILITDEAITPSFEMNEEVIVFLSADKGSRPDENDFGYYVIGQAQGVFSLKDSLQSEIIENNTKTISFDVNNIQSEINAWVEIH